MATIEVDDTLLEEALEVTGERTYSDLVTNALEEILRIKRMQRALNELKALGDNAFAPEFLAEIDARRRDTRRK